MPRLADHPADAILFRCCGMALVRSGRAIEGLPHLARARILAPGDGAAALWHGFGLHAAGR